MKKYSYHTFRTLFISQLSTVVIIKHLVKEFQRNTEEMYLPTACD